MMAPSVLDQPVRYDAAGGSKHVHRRHALYVVFTAIVSMIVLAAVVEAISSVPLYGVDTETVASTNGNITLEVTYPHVTRGGLQTALRLDITRAGGFDEPVTVYLSSAYLDLFPTDDLSPMPSSETTAAEFLAMPFDPPVGDELQLAFDLVAHPRGMFDGASATASVVDQEGNPSVVVRFSTKVRP